MKKIILFVVLSLLVFSAHAEDSLVSPQRPKVGLVLAGGGARGASFIGVLRYFDELDIPIDYIIGTSMGSVIGGIYALGYSPDEMQQLISSVDWARIIGNSKERHYLSNNMRERQSTQLLSIPINTFGIFEMGPIRSFFNDLPSAYVNNSELDNLLNELCQGYQGDINFEELPIPFACVATDIVESEEVLFTKGNLPKAIRASTAIPGLFSPVVIDGKLYYDGGLTNILPSDVLRDMGMDIIIGIEFSNEKFFEGDKIPHFSKIFDYVYNFVIHVKREQNKELCDILIKPNAAEFGPLSFTPEAIDTLISRGYQEAQKYHDVLMDLKTYLEETSGEPVKKRFVNPRKNYFENNLIYVNSIDINGPENDKIKWLKRKSKLSEHSYITNDNIKSAIQRYRGLGNFDAISYALTETDTVNKAYDLQFHLTPCSTPDIFGIGMRFDTKEGPAILLTYGFHEKRMSGFKFNLKGRISFSPRINATMSQTIFPIANLNLSYDFWWPYSRINFNNDKKFNLRTERHEVKTYISPYQVQNLNAQLGFAFVSTNFGQINTNDPQKDSLDMAMLVDSYFKNNKLFGPYFSINYDNLDRSYFARHGINATLSGHTYLDIDKEENAFYDLSFMFQAYMSILRDKLTLIPQLYGRFLFCDSPLYNYQNCIGDEIVGRYTEYQLPFIGLNGMRPTSDETLILRCDLRYNIYGKHYLTALYNFIPDHYSKSYSGVGLSYSYNSIFGPFTILGQWSDYNEMFSAFVSFGFNF